jgi:coenzyme F420-dependent glucose-6-phosphate dehydrogenase
MERVADEHLDQAHTRFIVSDDPDEVVEKIGTYLDLGSRRAGRPPFCPDAQ